MADISIQFHALPEEIVSFVKQCVSDFDLHVVAMKFFPFNAIGIAPDEIDELFSGSSPYEDLALTLHKPSLPVKSQMDFYDKNPGQLQFNIRRIGEKGLEQAWLAARTDQPDALSVWKKIAKRLKGMTQTGVVAINPDTGATALARSFRFTAGAKALEASGVPMLPAAGGCVLKLGIPADPDEGSQR